MLTDALLFQELFYTIGDVSRVIGVLWGLSFFLLRCCYCSLMPIRSQQNVVGVRLMKMPHRAIYSTCKDGQSSSVVYVVYFVCTAVESRTKRLIGVRVVLIFQARGRLRPSHLPLEATLE